MNYLQDLTLADKIINQYPRTHYDDFDFYDFFDYICSLKEDDEKIYFLCLVIEEMIYGNYNELYYMLGDEYNNLNILNAFSSSIFKIYKKKLKLKEHGHFFQNKIEEVVHNLEYPEDTQLKNYISNPKNELYRIEINEVLDFINNQLERRR